MSDSISMSLETARMLAVYKQGLHRRPGVADQARSADRETLLDGIRRIGLLQLDSISVVARSHYLVMLSRVGLYDPADLDALLYPDRRLFEGWAHAACLIPVEDYGCFVPTLLARRERPPHHWVERRLGDDPQGILDAVLKEVRERGPLASRDFEDTRDGRGTWWDWKPAKTALEILFAHGYLMVDRRESFQRYYDLAERVLPASANAPAWTMEEYQRWATLRGVGILGVATASHASDYYRLNKPSTRARLKSLAAEGVVLTVEVEGWKETAYLDPDDLPLVAEIKEVRTRRRLPHCCHPSITSSGNGTAPASYLASTTVRRCTPRLPSGSMATMCCPSCTGAAWWAAWTPRPTARPKP